MTERRQPILSIMIPYHASEGADRRGMLAALIATIPDIPEIEVVVVDDNSTLAFPELPRTHPILQGKTSEGRRYAGAARNVALELATGHFGLFADSDDLFAEGGLLRLLATLTSLEDEGGRTVVLLEPWEFSEDAPEGAYPLYTNVLKDATTDATKRLAGWHSPWAKAFNLDAVRGAGVRFEENLKVANDVLFSTRLALFAERIRVFPGKAYLVRRNHAAGALTAIQKPEIIRMRIEAQRRMNQCLREHAREDIAVPMHHPFRAHARRHPGLVLSELCKSIRAGERILPHRR